MCPGIQGWKYATTELRASTGTPLHHLLATIAPDTNQITISVYLLTPLNSLWQCIHIDKACNLNTCDVQMCSKPQSAPYQHQQSTIPWQPTQQVFEDHGGRGQPHYNQCMGTPIASQSAYNNQPPYQSQPRDSNYPGTPIASQPACNNQPSYQSQRRDSNYPGTSSNRAMLPFHDLPPGTGLGPQPGYRHEKEYYNS